jgi:hypothetical protein
MDLINVVAKSWALFLFVFRTYGDWSRSLTAEWFSKWTCLISIVKPHA